MSDDSDFEETYANPTAPSLPTAASAKAKVGGSRQPPETTKAILELCAAGHSLVGIRRELVEMKCKNSKGKEWSITVRQPLSNTLGADLANTRTLRLADRPRCRDPNDQGGRAKLHDARDGERG